jgi:hypothetical protein
MDTYLIYAVNVRSVPREEEEKVARVLAISSKLKKLPIRRIVAAKSVKDYVFVESSDPRYVRDLLFDARAARKRIRGVISPEALDAMVTGRYNIRGLKLGDCVEVVDGARKGRARIEFLYSIAGKDGGESVLALDDPQWGSVRADQVRPIGKSDSVPPVTSERKTSAPRVEPKTCSTCGRSLPNEAKFCDSCGHEQI